MKISTKGRYGLRSLIDMVIYSGGYHIPLCKIAERQKISENYLEHIFSILRKSGFVKSVKGSQGGYILSRNPHSIKVGDVLRSLEGEISVIENIDDDRENNIIENCIKKVVWDKLDLVINNLIDSISLEDAVNEYKKTNEDNEYTYFI